MTIDLSRIDAEPQDFRLEAELRAERLDADQVASPMRVRLTGTVRAAAGELLVEGRVKAEGDLLCARCLEPVPWQGCESFRLEIVRSAVPVAGDDEIELDDGELDRVVLDGDLLDLEELAAEQVMLALPMRVLCRDECAGLCPSCGANRNQPEACSCQPDSDPRWDALRGLAGRPS